MSVEYGRKSTCLVERRWNNTDAKRPLTFDRGEETVCFGVDMFETVSGLGPGIQVVVQAWGRLISRVGVLGPTQ